MICKRDKRVVIFLGLNTQRFLSPFIFFDECSIFVDKNREKTHSKKTNDLFHSIIFFFIKIKTKYWRFLYGSDPLFSSYILKDVNLNFRLKINEPVASNHSSGAFKTLLSLYISVLDLAEIFMNILVNRKILFYFVHRKSEMESSGKNYSIRFNNEDTANKISYVCSFVHLFVLFRYFIVRM